MTYQTIKNELRNYKQYLRNADRLKEEIEGILYEMAGVKGIKYDKVPGSYNQAAAQQRMLDLIEMKEEKELEYEHTLISLKLIEMKLSKLEEDDRKACIRIMSDGESYEKVGSDMGYTATGMWRRLKRKLEEI